MPEDINSGRFEYVYGSLEGVINGNGRLLSSVQSDSVVNAIFDSARKKSPLPVIGVCQPYYHEENKIGLKNAIRETSQKIVERVYGFRDGIYPLLTAIIYHPGMNHSDEIRRALPKSPIARVVLYPSDKMPKFDLKPDLTIQPEARYRVIFNCLTPQSEAYLREYADFMEGVGRRYGLTLPEFIAFEITKPNSKILSLGENKLLEQKTALAHLFLLLPEVNSVSQAHKTKIRAV
ncbi:MAG: hypothetical protein AABX07_05610 [Nanoarchaeota archaeon]